MNSWNMSNRQYAEQQALLRTLGYLSAYEGELVSADRVAEFIRSSVNEIEGGLNRRFPEKREA